MKEQIHTIPINDALNNAGECPLCYIKERAFKHTMDFCLGSGASYMESDIREMTDTMGFCGYHFKKMFEYGNSLGNAWILKTHYKRTIEEMDKQFKKFTPSKKSFKDKFIKNADTEFSKNSIANWIAKRDEKCFICDSIEKTYRAYLDTLFYMYVRDPSIKEALKNSKGFCLEHFKDVCITADAKLNSEQLKEFYDFMLPLMEENFKRIYGDISWFIEKFDYRNKDADWKESKDAIPRGMQKLSGEYVDHPNYESKK